MKYNTIIFDVDGTLIDTRSGIISSVRHVIDKLGLKCLSEDELYKFAGISPLQSAFCHFCNVDSQMSQKCAEEFRIYYNEQELFNATVYDGIIQLLDYLKTNNYKLGIATYKREDLVLKLLKHFDLYKYFDIVFGADNNNKLTKSDMIEKCIKNLNSQKINTIMIGDSYHDAHAAEKVGIDFIGVTYGFGFKTKQDIKEYPNSLYASTSLKIIEYFRNV